MTFSRIGKTVRSARTIVAVTLLGIGTAACSAPGLPASSTAPTSRAGAVVDTPSSARAGAAAEAMGANLAVDSAFAATDPMLVSTCPGTVNKGGSITWARFTECVVISPSGSTYALRNDPYLQVTSKRGVITHVTLYVDDVVGGEGVQHETDPIPVSVQAAYGGAGFVLHVHADRVPVYRLSGHIGGRRVAMIGTISVADVVYF